MFTADATVKARGLRMATPLHHGLGNRPGHVSATTPRARVGGRDQWDETDDPRVSGRLDQGEAPTTSLLFLADHAPPRMKRTSAVSHPMTLPRGPTDALTEETPLILKVLKI